jgi:hypothetical protein
MSESEKIIVIEQPWGGLGDNLQFSTLPELYNKLGYKVYISVANAYRNPEIFDLVWKLNPFISGFSNRPPNAGPCRCQGDYFKTPDYCTDIEVAHGLTNGYRKYPVVYYTPKLIPELSSCLLYDTTAISITYTDHAVETNYMRIFGEHPDLVIKKINYEHMQNRSLGQLSHETYTIRSIYDLCDAIYSCKVFVCLLSGAAALASAIKQESEYPKIYVYRSTSNDKGFKWSNQIFI